MMDTILNASKADTGLASLLDEVREYASVYVLARQRQKGCDGMGELATMKEEFRDAVDKMIQYCKEKKYVSDDASYELDSIADQINLINVEDPAAIRENVIACEKKSPGRFDRTLTLKEIGKIEAKPPRRLILDPSGFFIIYPKKEENRICLEHYRADGTLNEIIHGEDPILIASIAIERNLVSRLDHAAYLGRELEKAYLSMCYGFQYIQDSAPGKVE